MKWIVVDPCPGRGEESVSANEMRAPLRGGGEEEDSIKKERSCRRDKRGIKGQWKDKAREDSVTGYEAQVGK